MASACSALKMLFLTVMTCAFAAGCGPITAHSVIRDAIVAVEAAESAGAKDGAPYEYYSAQSYLKKAREEEGYSDYQAAVDLAKQSIKFADEARAKAVAGGDPDQRIDPKRAKTRVAPQGPAAPQRRAAPQEPAR